MSALTQYMNGGENHNDPTLMGWPVMLPLEIALNPTKLQDIREAYGIEDDDWEELKSNEAFRLAVKQATERIAEEGMSYKLKAQTLAEQQLANLKSIADDETTPAAVRVDVAKFLAKVAGYEPQKADASANQGPGFSININFGASTTATTALPTPHPYLTIDNADGY